MFKANIVFVSYGYVMTRLLKDFINYPSSFAGKKLVFLLYTAVEFWPAVILTRKFTTLIFFNVSLNYIMKFVLFKQLSLQLYSCTAFRKRFVIYSLLIERSFSWSVNWRIYLFSTRNIFCLNQPAPLARWWGPFSDNISSKFYGHWIRLLLAFRWNNFAHLLHLSAWIPLNSIWTRLLCSYWNLVSFLFTDRLINIQTIQWFLINNTFLLDLIFEIFFLIYGIILYCSIAVWMILLHEIFKQLLYSIWAFWVKILGFLHLSDLEVNFLNQAGKFVLISLLICIKFENSFLQNVQQTVDAMVVCFLLLAGRKSWINRHGWFFVTIYIFFIMFNLDWNTKY